MNLKTLLKHSLRPRIGFERSRKRRRRRPQALPELLEARALLTPGANLAFYEFANHTSATPELFSSDAHAETTASDISSPLSLGWTGNGQPPNGLALWGAFNETTEPTPAGGQPDYFEFTITPNVGYSMNVAAFSLLVRRNDPTSKNSFSVYFDEDPGSGGNNYTTKILSGVVTSEDQFESFSINTESMPAFSGITTPLNFRVYAWGTAGTETMRLDNIRVQSVQETVSQSKYAYYGDADRLIIPLDERGNRVPDFSAAGYMYGNEPIPDVAGSIDAARIVTVSPIAGDDMANIQAAIDQVGLMTSGSDGFRGVVQLTAGEFEISNQLQILQSGIVLRGVGDGADPASSTILRGTGTIQRSLVVVGPASGFVSPQSGTTHNITDKYVPVGATSFEVDSTDSWAVGDEVVVKRPSTAEWIADIGMDSIPPRSDGGTVTQWSPGGNYDQPYERVITRIEGNRIFLNAPLTNSFEQQYGGGTVFKYTFPRISHVGIESIRGLSDFVSDTDEDHARSFIELQAIEHAWVTNVTGLHFVYATVHATSRSRMVTVDDAVSLDPKSIITGARRYPFVIDGQFTLMQNLYSEEGRHDFVNNSAWRNRGPNVFLNGTAVNSHSSTGPHQRWSTGTLYDTIVTDNQIEARNRGNFGSGHGWGGANMVFWNTVADSFIVQNPQTAQNWLIGSTGTLLNETRFGPQPPPNVDAHDTSVDFGRPDNPTSSLFVAQLNQRTAYGFEKREYVLGDYDQAEFDGSGSSDEVYVDATWRSGVEALAGGQAVNAFDTSSADQFVPASFQFGLAQNEGVTAAVLTLGLRGNGSDTTGDSLWLDDLTAAHSLTSLGLVDSLSATTTTPLTIELTGSDLLLLQDGLLNLAVNSNTVLDWATLDLSVGPVLTVEIGASSVSEGDGQAATTATVTRSSNTANEVVVTLSSSDVGEATVPTTVTIPAGETTSPPFDIAAINDQILDSTQTVNITAAADGFVAGVAVLDVTDILAHRMSNLTVRVQDQNGNPLSDATIDAKMTQHGFTFGTQVRDRLFGITQSEFDALNDNQKRNLLETGSGTGHLPTWQDVQRYHQAVTDHFNHVVPTNGIQWVTYQNSGPANIDTAVQKAQDLGFGVTGHAVVWGNDGWPTPTNFRPAANPDPQMFYDALIADRLSNASPLARYSDTGAGPTIIDWDVLNEPIHELYYANTFTTAGIYSSTAEMRADIFRRAHALRPDARLAINEYNIISWNDDSKARAYRDLVIEVNDILKNEDAQIDVIKVQAHIWKSNLTKADIARRLDILAETGLPIVISEFDMQDSLNIAQQEQTFRNFLEAAFEHPAVEAFTMWGFWNPGHWRGNGPLYDIDWNLKAEAAPWTDLVEGDWMPGLDDVSVDSQGSWKAPLGLFNGTYTVTASLGNRTGVVQDYQLNADDELVVVVDELALAVSLDAASISENAGVATGTVTRNGDNSLPLTVTLTSSDTGEAIVPATVTIPAASGSATFQVNATDDEVVDGTQLVSITASATDYANAVGSLDITDDEVAELTIHVVDSSISENGGVTTATISRNTDTTAALTVTVVSGDTTEATVPTSIVIPAGATESAPFDIVGVDDAVVDGAQSVTITVSATDHASANGSLDVTDDDTAELTLSIVGTSISENGGATTATVSRNTDTTAVLTVTVISGDTSEATVPTSIVIPAGESESAPFSIAGVDDAVVDGTQTVTITVSANDHANGTDSLDVTDDDTAPPSGDVDGDSDFDANDSFLIHLVKLSGTDLQISQSKGSSPLADAEIRAGIQQLPNSADVDGDQDFDANDSFLIHLVKLSGTDFQIEQSKGGSNLSAAEIRSRVAALGQSPGGSNRNARRNMATTALMNIFGTGISTTTGRRELFEGNPSTTHAPLIPTQDSDDNEVVSILTDFRSWIDLI